MLAVLSRRGGRRRSRQLVFEGALARSQCTNLEAFDGVARLASLAAPPDTVGGGSFGKVT